MAEKKQIYKELQYLPTESLIVSDWNVRKHQTSKGIEELARSIEEIGGILQPLVVYSSGGKYEVLIGQRRYHSALKLGLKSLPALIIEKPTDELDANLMSFAENVHRRELPFKNTVEVISALYKKYQNPKKVAQVTGLSQATVHKYLGLSAAPEEVKEMVERKELTREDATKALLAGGGEPDKVIQIAKRISELAPPEKNTLLELSEENPKAEPSELIKEAKKPRAEVDIHIKLPSRYFSALNNAASALSQDVGTTATHAVQEWLIGKGHFTE